MPETSAARTEPELRIREMPRNTGREIFATVSGSSSDGVSATIEHLRNTHDAAMLVAEYFGDSPTPGMRVPGGVPITWVVAESPGGGIGGSHLQAVAGLAVTPLLLEGRVVGTAIEGPHATECMLAGICSSELKTSPSEQARVTFETIERMLEPVQMDFSHVARTWLYLDDILGWYDDFNVVRTQFFNERGVFDRMVPASTGIGGRNPAGAAMVAACYAVKPKSPDVTVRAVTSPLQCPALDYGSAFSRAVEVAMPDLRRLFISGTASISPKGETEHIGDAEAQAHLIATVVEAILDSRDMNWCDVTRATAYVRSAHDAGVIETFRATAKRADLPIIAAHNVICRDELLVELEIDAVMAQ